MPLFCRYIAVNPSHLYVGMAKALEKSIFGPWKKHNFDDQLSGAVGTLTMRRLQAPARHKPGIEQHQRRALWPHLRETASNLQKRAAGKPLCGRFGAGSHLTGTDTAWHRRAQQDYTSHFLTV